MLLVVLMLKKRIILMLFGNSNTNNNANVYANAKVCAHDNAISHILPIKLKLMQMLMISRYTKAS